MESTPLVTIIMTAFNQSLYVEAALDSLKNEGYPNVELFIIDNGSTDDTTQVIKNWLNKNELGFKPKVFYREESLPYCQSFNQIFLKSKGKYLIDFAGDDLMLPGHIAASVLHLQEGIDAACCFSDVLLLEGNKEKTFYKRKADGHLGQKIKIGNIYREIVAGNPVSSVSLVFDALIFANEGGYDEDLVYEDFDIMVRLSRKYQFVFSNHIGMKKRIHSKSFAASQYLPYQSKMLASTLVVCRKIKKLNKKRKEDKALLTRVLFEAKHALWSANFEVAHGFLELAKELKAKGPQMAWYHTWANMKMDVSGMYLFLKKINQR